MGSSLSSVALTIFEIFNEIYVSISAGFFGLIILSNVGIKNHNFVGTSLLSLITVASLMYVYQDTNVIKPSHKLCVFITGCDSGLGYSIAHHACEMGFTVLAGCLKLDSDGAKKLRQKFGDRVKHIEIDITRITSVEVAVEVIEEIINRRPHYRLWAVINNAGVMVFGEFEWLTERLIQDQIDVNLIGTLRLTKAVCPLLRKHKGRLINISSHCALTTLPGLAVYGATKAALVAWSDGLRVELNKYGVNVITFIPGSFVQHSNIMARQSDNCLEMFNAFTKEQKEFYGDYFKRYNSYLKALSAPKIVTKIDDPAMFCQFEKCLVDVFPRTIYIHEPWRYSVYHTLFKLTPVIIRDYLVTRFIQMPEYVSSKRYSEVD